jgi:hypothetical protein
VGSGGEDGRAALSQAAAAGLSRPPRRPRRAKRGVPASALRPPAAPRGGRFRGAGVSAPGSRWR